MLIESSSLGCYKIRTIMELVISSMFLIFIYPQKLFEYDELIPCQVEDHLYVCSGHPHQFYNIVLKITIIILGVYIIANVYNLLWILKPSYCKLNQALETLKEFKIEDPICNNPDLRLLLNFLYINNGIGSAIAALCLFSEVRNDFFGVNE